jgi:hypothetical protein
MQSNYSGYRYIYHLPICTIHLHHPSCTIYTIYISIHHRTTAAAQRYTGYDGVQGARQAAADGRIGHVRTQQYSHDVYIP